MNRAHKNKHYIPIQTQTSTVKRPVILAAGRFLFGFMIYVTIEYCPDVVNIGISGAIYTHETICACCVRVYSAVGLLFAKARPQPYLE